MAGIVKPFIYASYKSTFKNIPDVMKHMIDLHEELNGTTLENLRYFNKTYYIITKNVYSKNKEKYFQYPKDLIALDIHFAKYYFDALQQYTIESATTPAWQVAFQSYQTNTSMPLIYIALGVNAHVNNDLGLTLFDVIDRDNYRTEYDKVNTIIYDSLDEVIEELHLQNYLKPFMNILIKRWRNNAWLNYDYLKKRSITIGQIESSAKNIADTLAKINSTRDFYQLYHVI
jgi:hypothetical protein